MHWQSHVTINIGSKFERLWRGINQEYVKWNIAELNIPYRYTAIYVKLEKVPLERHISAKLDKKHEPLVEKE